MIDFLKLLGEFLLGLFGTRAARGGGHVRPHRLSQDKPNVPSGRHPLEMGSTERNLAARR